jgi:hypothetical protein
MKRMETYISKAQMLVLAVAQFQRPLFTANQRNYPSLTYLLALPPERIRLGMRLSLAVLHNRLRSRAYRRPCSFGSCHVLESFVLMFWTESASPAMTHAMGRLDAMFFCCRESDSRATSEDDHEDLKHPTKGQALVAKNAWLDIEVEKRPRRPGRRGTHYLLPDET